MLIYLSMFENVRKPIERSETPISFILKTFSLIFFNRIKNSNKNSNIHIELKNSKRNRLSSITQSGMPF